MTDLFNVLTGLSRQRTFRRLLVAPHSLRSRFLELVEREIGHARAGRDARIVLKLNAIVDGPSIEALYEASQAGVRIDLIIRAALLAPARASRASPRTSASARSSASSSSTRGSGRSRTAATASGTSARRT